MNYMLYVYIIHYTYILYAICIYYMLYVYIVHYYAFFNAHIKYSVLYKNFTLKIEYRANLNLFDLNAPVIFWPIMKSRSCSHVIITHLKYC